jgi:hypothetical protein
MIRVKRCSTKTLRVFALFLGMSVLAGVTGFAYAKSTSKHSSARHAVFRHRGARLEVFSHPLRRAPARVAAHGHVPVSAVLAAASGHHDIYVWEGSLSPGYTGSNLCIEDLTPDSSVGAGCGRAATVVQHGIVVVSESDALGVNVNMLLPNGVTQVNISNRDGTGSTLSVSNNVAEIEDADIASVSYEMASGATITEVIPPAATEPARRIR